MAFLLVSDRNEHVLFVELNLSKLHDFLQVHRIFLRRNDSQVRLGNLLTEKRLHVNLLIFDLETEYLMRIINVLVNKGVFKHLAGAESDEEVPCHIVGEIGQDNSSTTSLLYRTAVDLDKVEVAVDINLAVLVVHNGCCGQYLTVLLCEMDQSLQFVDICALHKVWRVEWHLEPLRYGQLLVAAHTTILFLLLIDEHVHVESCWIEVKHDDLFAETESGTCTEGHIFQIIVESLFKVDCW